MNMEFKLKSTRFQGWQVTKPTKDTELLPPPWVIDALGSGKMKAYPDGSVSIETPYGICPVAVGHWILREENGCLWWATDEDMKHKYERLV